MLRPRAHRLVEDLVDRAQSINADGEMLLWVDELTVFGSYANPDAADIGDIDVMCVLTRRYDDWDEYSRRNQERIASTGAHPRNMVEELGWPEIETKKLLRNRSGRISLMDPANVDVAVHLHTIYRREPYLVSTAIPGTRS